MSEEAELHLETVDIEVEDIPQETEQELETSLFSSSDYNNEELVRLVELQRRHTENQNPDIDGMEALDDDDDDEEDDDDDGSDDFSVHGSKPKGPLIPDMRFEKQFEKAVSDLKEKGHGRLSIFWSTVVKDQIIVPFVSGFTWSICSTAWSWYRVKGKVTTTANKDKSSSSFLRGLKYGFANWLRQVYNAILRNTGALRPALGA